LKPSSNKLQKIVQELIKKYNIPGLSLAIIKNGKIGSHLEFGVKNSNYPEPVLSNTVFEAASLSKPVVAYGALILVKNEIFDIDKPLRDYLNTPYMGDPAYLSEVTLRHVLSHTSGFPNVNLKKGESLTLAFPPGSHFNYSGESFRYLGKVIEHLYGASLETFYKKVFFVL